MKKKSSGNVRNRFKDMKLKYKLAGVYAIAGFLPVIIILSATFIQMKNILRDKELDTINSYLYQATASVESEVQIYNNLANYISFNQTISQVLSYDYTSTYEMYTKFVSVMDPMLSSLLYFHSEVDRVTIYIDNGSVKHGDTLAPLSEIQDASWYQEVVGDNKIHWYVDKENHKAFSASKMAMLDRYGMTGVLYISVDYDSVFEPFNQSIMNNFGVYITDQKDEKVFEREVFDSKNKGDSLNYSQFQQALKDETSRYEIINSVSDTTGWKIYLYKPESLMVSSVQPIILLAVIAALVCVVATILCIRILSKFVTQRITSLQHNMKEVERGNLLITVHNDSKDEIGDLMSGFDSMLHKLNRLINEVYKGKIKEKEYEMRALQAQINPHFLYNTLSLINWKAIEAGEMDISKITLSLSTFYRTSLNKGNNILTIAEEIDNIKSYLNIQLIMHDHDFDVDIQVDEGILGYKTLNLILQPLIENAIDHGIDLKSEGRGYIHITGRDEGMEILLVVEDNGIGMTEEQAMKIITEDSKGYGVRNVNERIKLYYGENYALQILSEVGVGTKAVIRFPKSF